MKAKTKPAKDAPERKRYTPRPVPANSGAVIDSPENTTTRVRVRRWCDLSGKPTLFMVVDENGRELCEPFPYEPHALAYASALEAELNKTEPGKE